jgi:hypothetical protein
MTLHKTDFSAAAFEGSLVAELSNRGGELPLSDFCEQGGTPANIALNLHDLDWRKQSIAAQLEVIFDEHFPFGCRSAIQERTRRVKFRLLLIPSTGACEFTPIVDDTPDL